MTRPVVVALAAGAATLWTGYGLELTAMAHLAMFAWYCVLGAGLVRFASGEGLW